MARRLVAGPLSASAASPLLMPFSDDKAHVDVHLLQFAGTRVAYVDPDSLSVIGGADLTISSADGAEIFATDSGTNFFAEQVTYVESLQDGGTGFNAIHRLVISPFEGYFALRVNPDFDPVLAEQRTPAFDNLSWQAQDVEDALNEIFGAVGIIRVSKVSDFILHIEYTGALTDTALPDLPHVSGESLCAQGLAFELDFDDTKRALVEAAGPAGLECVITLRVNLSGALAEHVLFSAPITLLPTPDLP